MPAGLSHYLLCEEIINLDSNRESEKNFFHFGAQLYDMMYFYNYKLDMYNNMGKIMHKYDTYALFNALNKVSNTSWQKSLAYGLVTHYVFDITVHPYVYYCETKYAEIKVDGKRTEKIHYRIESDYDIFLYEKLNKKPEKNVNCFFQFEFSDNEFKQIFLFLKDIFLEAYNIQITERKFKSMLNRFQFFSQLLHDPNYKKQKIIRFFEKTFTKHFFTSTFFRREIPQKNYLNEDKNEWYNINDKNITSNLSMLELFEKAKYESIRLIQDFKNGDLSEFDKDLNTSINQTINLRKLSEK